MRWVWTIRLMLVAACVVAILEHEGVIRPVSHTVAVVVVAVCLALNYLVYRRATRTLRNRR